MGKIVPDPQPRDTRTALVRSAERLIAENGLANISLKMITKEAGARNTSAVQYHFGNVESLIKEVFWERYRSIERERAIRLAKVPAKHATKRERLMDLMIAAIGPMMDTCHEEEGRLYVRFCLQFISDPRFDYGEIMAESRPESVSKLRENVLPLLSDIPPLQQVTRLRRASLISIMQAADYAKQVESKTALPPEVAIREAASCLVSYISAPAE